MSDSHLSLCSQIPATLISWLPQTHQALSISRILLLQFPLSGMQIFVWLASLIHLGFCLNIINTEKWLCNRKKGGLFHHLGPSCSNQALSCPMTMSILKEINPEYSLEGLMLKLKLQHFGHLIQRANSLEKILMLGKIEARMRRGDRGWDG